MTGPTHAPLVIAHSQGLPGNDSKHNKTDLNRGGGPAFRNRKKVPPKHKGGFGQHGQQRFVKAPMGGGRGSSGNPARRGAVPGEARGASFTPEQRVPGHGGSVQTRSNIPPPANRGGFGHSGQQGVPGVRTNPQPDAGNLGGRMAKRIGGRFKQDTKGSRAGSAAPAGGKWGGPPVRLDT